DVHGHGTVDRMLLRLDVAAALVHVQLAPDVAVVLDGEQELIGIDDRDGTVRLDVARVYRAGFVVLDVHHRLVHIGREDQRELLQPLDELVHVLHHTGNRLVLVHHAVEPEGPRGRPPPRRDPHTAQRVAEAATVAP